MSTVAECKTCGNTVHHGPCLCATCAQHLEEDRDWWKAAYAGHTLPGGAKRLAEKLSNKEV